MRKLSLLLLFLLWIPAFAREKKPDPYQKIETQKQADGVLTMVTQDLRTMFGMNLSYPVDLHLVDGKEMDAKFSDSPYKGAEIGLYTGIKGGRHQVYVMEGWSLDKCRGTTAHELTHAWQTENNLNSQEQALIEGLAMWVEMKYYDKIGAYQMSENVRDTADPVYGVGIKALMALEDKVGAHQVLQAIKNVSTVAEIEALAKKR